MNLLAQKIIYFSRENSFAANQMPSDKFH